MRNVMRAGLIVAAFALLLAGTAFAQESAVSELSRTMVGDAAGAYQVWNVDLPANTDVTLTLSHWPCNTGPAIGIEVWGADGLMGMSSEKDACTQELSWNTGDGGPAEIKAYNYLPGVGTWWSMSATGLTLPGATAPMAAEPAAEGEMAAEAAPAEGEMAAEAAPAEGEMAKEAAPAEGEMAAEAAPVEAAAAPAAGTVSVDNAVLYGTEGGGIMKYDFLAEGGKTYDVTMTYGSPLGGTWPGVGIKVWGLSGLVATGSSDGVHATASFTAGGNDQYTVEVYNYHPGLPIFYSLEVVPQ
jgi:hypothetical protein